MEIIYIVTILLFIYNIYCLSKLEKILTESDATNTNLEHQ